MKLKSAKLVQQKAFKRNYIVKIYEEQDHTYFAVLCKKDRGKLYRLKTKDGKDVTMTDATSDGVITKFRKYINNIINGKDKTEYTLIEEKEEVIALPQKPTYKFKPRDILAPKGINVLEHTDVCVVFAINENLKTYTIFQAIAYSNNIHEQLRERLVEDVEKNYEDIDDLPENIFKDLQKWINTEQSILNEIQDYIEAESIPRRMKTEYDINAQLKDLVNNSEGLTSDERRRMLAMIANYE